MQYSTRSSSTRRWRRATTRAVVIGAVATTVVASTASAREDGDYPEQVPPYNEQDDGGSSTTVPEHDPIANDAGCSTIFDEDLDTDVVKLLDRGIDFGDNNWSWLGGAPVGVASVQWSVECGFYSAEVVGHLHLDGESGRSGRVHVSFWNYGEYIETRHSRTRTAPDNDHYSWSVNLSSPDGVHITEVHVCTEISDDGVHFDFVNCKTRLLG